MKNTTTSTKKQSAAAWADSGRSGDTYYSTMSAWVVSNCRDGSEEKCRGLAIEYDRTLDTFLAFTRELPSSIESENDISRALDYKSILARDLDYFDGHAGPTVYGSLTTTGMQIL